MNSRADDSAGIIGDACHRLIDLHSQAATFTQPQQVRLANWFWSFHFDEEVDFFRWDPVAYAPALGEKGLGLIRTRVNALREELPPENSTASRRSYNPNEFLVRWFDQRFSVLDRDFDATIRTHLRNGGVAAKLVETVGEGVIGDVQAALEPRPADLVRFQLDTMEDPALA